MLVLTFLADRRITSHPRTHLESQALSVFDQYGRNSCHTIEPMQSWTRLLKPFSPIVKNPFAVITFQFARVGSL